MTREITQNPIEECLPALFHDGPPVVIFALTAIAEVILRACRDSGIEVAAFADSKEEKTRVPHFDLDVIQRNRLPERFPEARILIATPDFASATDQLLELGYDDIYSAASLLRTFNWDRHSSFKASKSFLRSQTAVYLLSHDSNFNPERLFLRSIDIVITERCSLKCRNCSNLMQYYTEPGHSDHARILAAAERLGQAVDAIGEFRIIGGEPLMNPNWHLIAKDLGKRISCSNLVVYTNGTIVPDNRVLEDIRGEGITFSITDYGALSKKCNDLIAKLKKFDIGYNRVTPEGWVDCAGIAMHDRTDKERRDVFAGCCVKILWTMMHGKLYRCPFSANLDALRAIPDADGDYVDLLDDSPVHLLKSNIQRLNSVDTLKSCDWCNGRYYDSPAIFLPAIQTPTPLVYMRYERNGK